MKVRLLSIPAFCLWILVPGWARADGPDVKKILKEADDATKEVKGVAYEAEFFVTGDAADQAPHIKGKVKLKKPKQSMLGGITGGNTPPMRVEGTIKRPNADEPIPFKIATDGKMAYVLDDAH